MNGDADEHAPSGHISLPFPCSNTPALSHWFPDRELQMWFYSHQSQHFSGTPVLSKQVEGSQWGRWPGCWSHRGGLSRAAQGLDLPTAPPGYDASPPPVKTKSDSEPVPSASSTEHILCRPISLGIQRTLMRPYATSRLTLRAMKSPRKREKGGGLKKSTVIWCHKKIPQTPTEFWVDMKKWATAPARQTRQMTWREGNVENTALYPCLVPIADIHLFVQSTPASPIPWRQHGGGSNSLS